MGLRRRHALEFADGLVADKADGAAKKAGQTRNFRDFKAVIHFAKRLQLPCLAAGMIYFEK